MEVIAHLVGPRRSNSELSSFTSHLRLRHLLQVEFGGAGGFELDEDEGETGDDTKTMQAVRAAAKLAQLSDLATVANAMPGRLPSWMGSSDKAIRPPKVCESGEVLWAVDAGLQKADTGAPPGTIAHEDAFFEPDELTAWLRSALAYEGVAPRLSLLPLSPKAAAATALPTRVFGNFGNVSPELVTLASLRAACTGSIAAIEDCIGAGHEETVAKRWEAFAGGDYPRPDLEQGARSMRTTMWKDALREVAAAGARESRRKRCGARLAWTSRDDT